MNTKWTDSEIAVLCELVDDAEFGRPDWNEISKSVGRSPDSCRKKYRRIIISKTIEPGKSIEHVIPDFPDLSSPEVNIDEWLEELSKIQSLRMKAQPHTTVADIVLDTDGDPIAFSPTSCWHIGGLYTFYKGFKEKLVELFEIPRFYWGIHGDEYEGFPPGWASTVFLNLVPPEIQRLIVAKIIDKIHEAGKLLYACWSNHPAFMERLTGEDQAEILYSGKVPYFRGAGVLKLKLGEQTYILDVAHSFPGTSYHNPSHSQGRELSQGLPQADFVIQGHKHSYAYQEMSHRTKAFNAGLQENLIARLVQVGTAKTGPDPYTLRRWSAGVLIWPTFALSAKQHEIHRVYDRAALEYYLGREDF